MAKNKKKSKKIILVPQSGSGRVKIRFVGHQQEIFQYFNKNYFNGGSIGGPTPAPSTQFAWDSVAMQPSLPPAERVFFREEDNGDSAYTVSKRVASLVINREDETIKAFACPISLWNQMTEHAKENDFEIWREGFGLQTRYHLEPMGVTLITKEQEKTIEATLKSYTFADIFVKKEWDLVSEEVKKIKNRCQILDFSK